MDLRPVPDYPGYYATPAGQVFSERNHATGFALTELKGVTGRYGYIRMNLCRKGHKPTLETLHKIILLTFVGPRPKGMQARHLDGNPGNNSLLNLKWGTSVQNMADREVHGRTRHGERNNKAKLTSFQVKEIRQAHASGASRSTLAAQYGVFESTIRSIVVGETWKHAAGPRVASAKGQVKGEANGKSILTEETVRYIRRLHREEGKGGAEIAQVLNLKPVTVYAVISGRNWRHVK